MHIADTHTHNGARVSVYICRVTSSSSSFFILSISSSSPSVHSLSLDIITCVHIRLTHKYQHTEFNAPDAHPVPARDAYGRYRTKHACTLHKYSRITNTNRYYVYRTMFDSLHCIIMATADTRYAEKMESATDGDANETGKRRKCRVLSYQFLVCAHESNVESTDIYNTENPGNQKIKQWQSPTVTARIIIIITQQPCCRDVFVHIAHDDQRNVYLSLYLESAAEKCEKENHINRVEYDSQAFANTFAHTSRVHDACVAHRCAMCHLVVDNTTTSTDGDFDDDDEHKIRIYHKMRFIVRHRYIHFSDPDWSLLSGNLSWFVCMCRCCCCELLQIHSRKIALFKVDKWSPWLVTWSFWISWKFCVCLLHYATQHAHTVTCTHSQLVVCAQSMRWSDARTIVLLIILALPSSFASQILGCVACVCPFRVHTHTQLSTDTTQRHVPTIGF